MDVDRVAGGHRDRLVQAVPVRPGCRANEHVAGDQAGRGWGGEHLHALPGRQLAQAAT